jgi:uncharacterized membrane protein YebE (DUF533 family)
MFDAKNLLETLMRGAAPGQPSQQAQQSSGAPSDAQDSFGGLHDLLRKMAQSATPSGQQDAAGTGNSLGDIINKVQQQMAGGGGNLMDVLSQVLGQATSGVKEGAQRIDQATGASGKMSDAVDQATGQTPEELLNQLKQLIANNQTAAGVAAGGLGAVLLGTKAGRSLTGSAVKLGALAMIGGLAYKAMQNDQQGKPLLDIDTNPAKLAPAPKGSGFEPAAVTNDAALLYIRGMIAAAAADGRIDPAERQSILDAITQAKLDAHAEQFLNAELKHPASVDELARAVRSPEEAVQLLTAARLAASTPQGGAFVNALAQKLGVNGSLVAHINAMAQAA